MKKQTLLIMEYGSGFSWILEHCILNRGGEGVVFVRLLVCLLP
uniref:Uncharacterized protein n=1 Tax=Anguilla anguilla TaxID=7936 RepID=A0A0E9VDB4_ANGAN